MRVLDTAVDTRALHEDATKLAQALIRIDTVNPPGCERPAQELIAARLSAAGFQCELLAAQADRPNLLARLSGRREGPTLCLLGHTDTVLADPERWDHGPWSGQITDGFIWGRGALDMKSQVAAEVSAAAALGRSGWRPEAGDLLIAVVADEETGGGLGAHWLTTTHPEKCRCDMLLNEGGGPAFEHGERRAYGVSVAEKGVFRFTVTTSGVAVHASTPRLGENALLTLAPLLQRFAQRTPSHKLTEHSQAMLIALGEDPNDPAGALARLDGRNPVFRALLEAVLGVTFAPTKISASEKINVIPSSAELRVDCRVPPGLGEREVREAIAEVLGREDEGGFRIDFTERIPGNASPVSSPLMDAIVDWIAQRDPDASVAPTVMPGFTDSRHFRAAFPECVAYGFFPQRHQTLEERWPLIHGANERIDLRDLAFASECYADLVQRLLSGESAAGRRSGDSLPSDAAAGGRSGDSLSTDPAHEPAPAQRSGEPPPLRS